jgi:predicted metal-dependent hydrolase
MAITVRHPRFAFDALPRWWWADDPFLTHLVNGLGFVFPAGERFFVRSVLACEGQLDDPELKAKVRAFAAQEAQHGRGHRDGFAALRAQGFDVDGFLSWYEELAYGRIEPRFGPPVRLATTAAIEHFTAILGELVLSTDLLDDAHPEMRRLLLWHASEEVEHRAVAFEVFRRVDGRYAVRMVGYGLGAALFFGFWAAGTRHLLRQEPAGTPLAPGRRRLRGWLRAHAPTVVARLAAYARPGFHPEQVPLDALAERWLATLAA